MTQYRTTTDENGDFSLDLPALEKGTYTIKAIFEGDSGAYGSEITKTLIIQGRAYAISIEANNEIIQSGDTTTLTLSFEDEDGDPVIEPGQTIKLYQEYVVSDIILTSDKDILSYTDNDVATLTAKVKTSSGGIPVGVDVVFKKDDVLLDTVQTNTQGIATYSYTSTGAGDITFSAECDLVSGIYAIQDCLLWDPTGFTKTSNSTTDTTYVTGYDYSLSSINDFQLEFDFNNPVGFRLYFSETNVVNTGDNIIYGIGFGRNSSNKFVFSERTTTTSNTTCQTISSSTNHYKLVFNGNIVNVWVNDVQQISNKTISWWSSHFPYYFGWAIWATGTGTVSNIKIKAL